MGEVCISRPCGWTWLSNSLGHDGLASPVINPLSPFPLCAALCWLGVPEPSLLRCVGHSGAPPLNLEWLGFSPQHLSSRLTGWHPLFVWGDKWSLLCFYISYLLIFIGASSKFWFPFNNSLWDNLLFLHELPFNLFWVNYFCTLLAYLASPPLWPLFKPRCLWGKQYKSILFICFYDVGTFPVLFFPLLNPKIYK